MLYLSSEKEKYLKDILAEDEKVYILFRPWLSRMVIAPLMLLILGLFLTEVYIGFILLFIALIWLIYRYLEWKSTIYVLTDRRVIVKSGIIRIKHDEAPVDNIQNVFLRQGIIGRILNYGEISISTAGKQGEPTIIWRWVKNPSEVVRKLSAALGKVKKE